MTKTLNADSIYNFSNNYKVQNNLKGSETDISRNCLYIAQSKTPVLAEDKLLPPESFNMKSSNVNGNGRYGREGLYDVSKKTSAPKGSIDKMRPAASQYS